MKGLGVGGKEKANAMWWLTPIILALERLKQEDCHELEVSLDCLVNSRPACLKKQRITRKGKDIPIWISSSYWFWSNTSVLFWPSDLTCLQVHFPLKCNVALIINSASIDSGTLIICDLINLQTPPRHLSICKSSSPSCAPASLHLYRPLPPWLCSCLAPLPCLSTLPASMRTPQILSI